MVSLKVLCGSGAWREHHAVNERVSTVARDAYAQEVYTCIAAEDWQTCPDAPNNRLSNAI
jgi:hypothetical protein